MSLVVSVLDQQKRINGVKLKKGFHFISQKITLKYTEEVFNLMPEKKTKFLESSSD